MERHELTAAMFEVVTALLTEKRMLLKVGTMVDATIIAAPSSTKNKAQARGPEMKQARKGQQGYFGMKIHVGTDTRARRGRLQCRAALVGLCESALPRTGEEHDPCLRGVCPRQAYTC